MYTEESIQDQKILIITYHGELNLQTLVNTALEVRNKALQLRYRLLIDFTQINNQLSLFEGQSWIQKYLDPVNKELRNIPTVYIVKEVDFGFFKALQQIWDNHGIEIVIFRERDLGLEWLKKYKS